MNNNNPTPNLPNGNAPADPPKRPPPSKAALLARRRRAADPLVARKPPRPVQKRKPVEPLARDKDGIQLLTGLTSGPSVPKANITRNDKALEELERQRAANGGWSAPFPPDATSTGCYPVVTTKRALKEAMHFHIMKLTQPAREDTEYDIDPTNQEQFTRPVSLHRRDARQPPPGRAVKPEEEEDDVIPEDEVEAEKQAQIKAEKEAQKAIDRAQIAPSLKKDGTKPVAKADKPFMIGGIKSSKLDPALQEVRYAEALPWHLEDADGKNVWVGSYVQSLSNTHVAFVVQGSGFTMVPLDKYYSFKSKPPFTTYTVEEAERLMGKPVAPTRWSMRDQNRAEAEEELRKSRAVLGGRPRIKGESATSRARNATERFAREELDLEGDGDFSDDDEAVANEPDFDEDAKEMRDRMRKNHLNANLFGNTDEKDVEKQEALESKEDQARTEHGRHLRKALIKLEGHGDYLDSDDEFDDTSDEEEDAKKEEAKKEEAKKEEGKTDESKDKADGDVTMSGTSDAAKTKATDKKGKKRPGSPNLSESSGNESSRKKLKKGSADSLRVSRAGTPSLGRKAGGATSDGEGTAGEMSDSGPKRKLKNTLTTGTGPRGTPAGSRAGSPAPSAARAASPGSPLASPAKGPPVDIVTQEEIHTVMLAFQAEGMDGVGIGVLMKKFQTRLGGPGQQTKKDWISLVRKVCRFGDDKLLRLK